MVYFSLVSLTLAVASTSMTTTQEIADHVGSALSHLGKSYLGVERVTSEIKPTDFSTRQNDGENFVKIMAETTTGKIKTRMEQLLRNRNVVKKLYEANGRSDFRPKPLQCCEVEQYSVHYDPRFFGNILLDNMCMHTPDGKKTIRRVSALLLGCECNPLQ